MRICKVCDRPAYTRGVCVPHYGRLKKRPGYVKRVPYKVCRICGGPRSKETHLALCSKCLSSYRYQRNNS